SSGLQWTSTFYLRNDTNIKACIGDTVTLNWTFTLGAEENLDTVRWHFVPQGNPDAVEAILASGNFLPLPGSQHYGRLQYMPNAGIQVANVTAQDSGTYWVQVNLNKHGATYAEMQTADVQVSGPESCRSADEMLEMCLADSKDLTSQLQMATVSVQQQDNQIQTLRGQLQTCLTNAEPVTTTAPPPTYPPWFHPKNCRDLKVFDSATGVYTVFINDTTPVNVYCDQTDSGGEWL
ncbi:hypothetical protein BaRGS_00034572, partial [Batillaria attramentaria]